MPFVLRSQAVRLLPILCIDILLERKSDGRFLLVKRGTEPGRTDGPGVQGVPPAADGLCLYTVKGYWWVPGGRILRGETFFAAALRKAQVSRDRPTASSITRVKPGHCDSAAMPHNRRSAVSRRRRPRASLASTTPSSRRAHGAEALTPSTWGCTWSPTMQVKACSQPATISHCQV